MNHIVVTGYIDDAIATMQEESNGSGRFIDVRLHLRVTIGAGGDVELAARLHEEAHHYFVSLRTR